MRLGLLDRLIVLHSVALPERVRKDAAHAVGTARSIVALLLTLLVAILLGGLGLDAGYFDYWWHAPTWWPWAEAEWWAFTDSFKHLPVYILMVWGLAKWSLPSGDLAQAVQGMRLRNPVRVGRRFLLLLYGLLLAALILWAIVDFRQSYPCGPHLEKQCS